MAENGIAMEEVSTPMNDFVFGLFVITEISIIVTMTLIITYVVANRFRRVQITRIMRTVPFLRKKIHPVWGDQCKLCGAPMLSTAQCPRCHVTRATALDQVIYQYLTANDGVLARSEALSDLRVSEHELSESIERLTKAGKIAPFHATQGGLVS